MITGLSHITFTVADLERMGAFLEHIFGAREVYASGDRTFSVAREKFFLIGDVWVAIMEGEGVSPDGYDHVAFHVDEADFDAVAARVAEYGAQIRPQRPRVDGEGRSLYFYDHDGHLFEIHSGTLEERLARYR